MDPSDYTQHKLDDNMAVWQELKEIAMKYGCTSLGEGAPHF